MISHNAHGETLDHGPIHQEANAEKRMSVEARSQSGNFAAIPGEAENAVFYRFKLC